MKQAIMGGIVGGGLILMVGVLTGAARSADVQWEYKIVTEMQLKPRNLSESWWNWVREGFEDELNRLGAESWEIDKVLLHRGKDPYLIQRRRK